MLILNLMLGTRRGGLEQAAIDYAQALQHAGFTPLTITAPNAWASGLLGALPHATLPNMGAWDPLAALRLRRLAKRQGAAAIICHGNRALRVALKALKGRIPVIATAHNYSTRSFAQADAAFGITQQSIEHLAASMPRARLYFMPNMVRLPAHTHTPPADAVPVIGSMGRFVAKKAYPLLVEALAILKQRGVTFTARIGGGGPEEADVRAAIARHGVENEVLLPGWVEDKYAFLNQLDLFVLPSHHEPFGIVLIEAMGYGMPVISTRSEGPIEIITDGADGVLTPLADAPALADAMQRLLADTPARARMADAARRTVLERYSIDAMAARLKEALGRIISDT